MVFTRKDGIFMGYVVLSEGKLHPPIRFVQPFQAGTLHGMKGDAWA